MRVCEVLLTFNSMEMMFNVRKNGLKKALYERRAVLIVMLGVNTFCLWMDERQKRGVMEMKCLQNKYKVTRMDGWRNEKALHSVSIREKMSEKVGQKV